MPPGTPIGFSHPVNASDDNYVWLASSWNGAVEESDAINYAWQVMPLLLATDIVHDIVGTRILSGKMMALLPRALFEYTVTQIFH